MPLRCDGVFLAHTGSNPEFNMDRPMARFPFQVLPSVPILSTFQFRAGGLLVTLATVTLRMGDVDLVLFPSRCLLGA